jgi:hypothetical protein
MRPVRRKRFYGLQTMRTASQRRCKKQNESGKKMNPYITLDQPNPIARTIGKTTRKRHPLPPQETRDWMTPKETALMLGCSVATVHRLRRGVIPGIEPLPCSQYGRKFVFRKGSVARWQNNNEQRRLA